MKIIPFLTKEYARDHARELVDTGLPLDSLLHKPTSGSSGIPLNIYKTKETVASFFAFRVHILGRIGHTPKSREVMFWSMIELGKRTGIPFMEYGNRLVISGRHLTDDWLSQHYKKIRKFRPEFILGFPSTLSLLAAYIRKNDLPSLQGLKAIITYAETLYDWQRNLIGEVFGVRVFSMYALTEQAVIGGECEYSEAMHIQPLFGYTEPLRLREGYDELVSTGFTNYAMPFVRYRTGDLVAGLTGGCSQCGRHHQIAGRIEGRTDDFLVGKNGEIIPRLMPWIKRFDNVQCFQFFQEEPGRAYLKIVRSAKYSDDDTHVIRSKIDDMLGPMKNALDVDIVFVDGIPGTTSGKCKMVDQRLDMKKLLVS